MFFCIESKLIYNNSINNVSDEAAQSQFSAVRQKSDDDKYNMTGILIQFASTVPLLTHLCRFVIRRQLLQHTSGASIIASAFALQLPVKLQQYVLFGDVRQCYINHTPPHQCRVILEQTLCSQCKPEDPAKNLAANSCCHHLYVC